MAFRPLGTRGRHRRSARRCLWGLGASDFLTAAAEEYDRAARELWGRVPTRSNAGLQSASTLLAAARFGRRNENQQLLALLALLAQLVALSDAVVQLAGGRRPQPGR